MATLLDGKALSARVHDELAARVAAGVAAGRRPPGLALVLVGEDPASTVYVRGKIKACEKVGIRSFDHFLPESTSEEALLGLIAGFNTDPAVDGILVQLPLPAALSGATRKVIEAISPARDVDCFHPENVGRVAMGEPRFLPATPGGVMELLASAGISVAGRHAVVVGRSHMVGKPMAQLLLARDATVTICHSRTPDLEAHVRRADVLVAAVGRARMIPGAWIKEGAVVVDVGTNRVDGKLCGDVDFDGASLRASFISPVPGGVGPMTIATLLRNTVTAWERAG